MYRCLCALREAMWGHGSVILIYNLNTRWSLMARFTAQRLCPVGKEPPTHFIARWIARRTSRDSKEKRIIQCSCQESNHCSLYLICDLVTILFTLP
jgi:hypothetical protein